MRTTLTVDDSLLEELKALAARERRPFRQVVEECLLTGLRQRDQRLGEAAAGLIQAANLTDPVAKAIIGAIAKGAVPHISINY